jgi:hypothetical protein
MPKAVSILFGAAVTVAVSAAIGKLLLRALKLRFYRAEEHAFAFLTGAACLSLAVFCLAALRIAWEVTFLPLGAALIAVAVRKGAHRPAGDPLPPLGLFWKVVFAAGMAVFGFIYLVNAMAPEHSPDGSSYHLGLVLRYYDAHGFYRITTNFYAYLSQGLELLYLFAFSFGRHSAASLVHFAFLITLPLLMLFYALRFRLPSAGAAGALLVFMSPVVGWDGTTAYIDVAVACVLFGIFYLLQIWDQERTPELLVPIGVLAGFGYAMKYTAFPALPYALGFIGWKLWRKGERPLRPLAVVAVCALVMVAPWMVKNWIWVDNPFSPFLNDWFPNPYVHVAFEQDYLREMANWGGLGSRWEIPLEVTVNGGRLNGLLGPVFLLAPVALLALRHRAGRQLLLAAVVFGVAYPANIGTRFLIPPLPFLALAMGLVVTNWKAAAPVLLLFHALTSWPQIVSKYCNEHAPRLRGIPVAAALRIRPEATFLAQNLYGYTVSRYLDQKLPRDTRIFAYGAPPEAYTNRDILVAYQGALNNRLGDILYTPATGYWHPVVRLDFSFPTQRLRRVRIVQNAPRGEENWTVNEVRLFRGSSALLREPQWRLRAHPNPWEVQSAFDNNPISRWRSQEKIFAGMYIEVDLGRAEEISRVQLDTPPNEPGVQLWLEGQADHSDWRVLDESPERNALRPLKNLRRLATLELKWHGMEYLLLWPSDTIAEDVRQNVQMWGLELVAEIEGARLYRIE